jgi:hypothetical protein
MIIPALMLILIPLGACFVVLSTKLRISRDEIEKQTFLKTKKIRWEDVISIERKNFYVILPDSEEPLDIEVRDRKGSVIRVYRFLSDWEEAEEAIRLYAKKDV